MHSDAFWELAQLLAFALRGLGHDAYLSRNEFLEGFHNIVFGGHLLDDRSIGALPASAIFFNTEQLGLDDSDWSARVFALGRRLRIWDYSARNIARLKAEGCRRAALCGIGYHRALQRIEKQRRQDIDVLFYGSRNSRRTRIIKALMSRGLNVRALFGVYGAQRDEYIARSKVVLNLHHRSAQIFEVVRAHYLVNNEVPLVAEINPTTEIEDRWEEIVTGVAYEGLVDRCAELVADRAGREQLAAEALERLKQRPQEAIMADLLRRCDMTG